MTTFGTYKVIELMGEDVLAFYFDKGELLTLSDIYAISKDYDTIAFINPPLFKVKDSISRVAIKLRSEGKKIIYVGKKRAWFILNADYFLIMSRKHFYYPECINLKWVKKSEIER